MPWSVANYNTNPALNTLLNTTDISEGCQAAGYNDALRQIMADIRAWTDTYAVTYPIAVDKGGTGAITAGAARTNLDTLFSGYRILPRVNKAAAFTMAEAEGGSGIMFTGATATVTLDPESTTPITDGSIWIIYNNGSGVLTFAPAGGVTLLVNGATVTSGATLAIGGQATLINWSADRWTITGVNVT